MNKKILTAAMLLLGIGLLVYLYFHHSDHVAAFTAVLAYATLLLWSTTVSLVLGSEATAKTQLRAYVGPDSGNMEAGLNDWQVNIAFKNFGHTPATDVALKLSFEHDTARDSSEYSTSIAFAPDTTGTLPGSAEKFSYGGTLMPNTVWRHHLKIGPTKGQLLCSGTITYNDAFDQKHTEHFRFERGIPIGVKIWDIQTMDSVQKRA